MAYVSYDPRIREEIEKREQARREALLGVRGARIMDVTRGLAFAVSFSKPRPVPVHTIEEPESYLRWGQPSSFDVEELKRQNLGYVVKRSDDDDEPSLPPIDYAEDGRSTYEETFYNSGDPSQFVVIERKRSISFSNPSQVDRLFRFNLSTPG